MMKAVLIPIKEPSRAKTRLADLLSADERRRLAWAMLEDVTLAVAAATRPDRVVIVTNFQRAIEHSRRLGWDVLVEDGQSSESASIDWASRKLRELGFDLVMRVPADVPLLKADDLDSLLATELSAPAALLVPSRDGKGTNAIIRTPADLFPSRFGPNSLALHKGEAERVGVRCAVVDNPRLALDIDEPADLSLFFERGHGTGTFALLEEMKIAERMNGLRVEK